MHDFREGFKQLIEFLPILLYREFIVHVLQAVLSVSVEHFCTRFLLHQIVELKHQILLDARLQKLLVILLTHRRSAKGSGQSSIKIILRVSLSLSSLNISSSGSSYLSELKTHFLQDLQVALVAEFLEPLEFLGVSAEVVFY